MQKPTAEHTTDLSSYSDILSLHSERRSQFLILIAAAIGFVAGRVGSIERSISWQGLAGDFATLFVTLLAGFAAIRFMEVVRMRGEVNREAARSTLLALETRALLEEQFPGAADRATSIDAQELINRSKERRADARQRVEF